MENTLFIGFKGKNNSSNILVSSLSSNHILLTNSFTGLKKDIEELSPDYDEVYLFGVNKNLTDSFSIESVAEKDGKRLESKLDLEELKERFASFMIKADISKVPSKYLCNEAYWYLLENYKGNVVLIHIPTVKNFKEEWIESFKKAIN
ncbi:MAG: hypothetical protein J5625_07250 [Lachnospiraceae bacterium]|nr:hypothetical protein [Lachnospiraceae bacterium]